MTKPYGAAWIGGRRYTCINLTDPTTFAKRVTKSGEVKCPRCGSVELDVERTYVQVGVWVDSMSEYCTCCSCGRRYRVFSQTSHDETETPAL